MRQPVIGLEIHSQLKTHTKMFCGCANDPDETHPNAHVCPVCMGHPGTLPVPNKNAVEAVVKVGLALSCTIAERSKFDRKNYFYPDLPKGYQISQYDMPFAERGWLEVLGKRVRITRVHLEEDTGRLVHGAVGASFVDFNRAGVPLMELVTEPDITSAEEAVACAKKLQMIFQYLEVSDANMEKGQMRCEVNISMTGDDGARGTKVEIKNLNSFAAVRDAIAYEIKRQSAALEKGARVIQETRGWDENKKATVSQRLKESAHDYRYFPEPDIPAIIVGDDPSIPKDQRIDVARLAASLPELPDQKVARFESEFGIGAKDVEIIVSDKYTAAFFEHVVSELGGVLGKEELPVPVKRAVNYFNTDLRKLLNETGTSISEMRITPENFAELILLLEKGTVTSAAGKVVLEEMFRTGKDPSNIIAERGLLQTSDTGELERIAREAFDAHPAIVADYKKGKTNALEALVGKVMAHTKGKANPQVVRELFQKLLQ
ncbi:MAG: Asp-tRNA(Asn)/Glu-tRNA(Gln) amidotransferase subunit GatB [Patescibacteria group bacterium]